MTVLPELRRLLDVSTAAPWYAVKGPDWNEDDGGYLGWMVMQSPEQEVCDTGRFRARAQEDAELIVALRNHADALLDVVDAARTLVEDEYDDVRRELLEDALASLDRKAPLAGAYCTNRDHSFDGTRRDEHGNCPKCEAEGVFGFRWGPLVVQRVAHVENRGYCVAVTTDAGRRVELYVSEAGRVIRIRADGKTRWTVLGASDD